MEKATELLERYRSGKCSEEEKLRLNHWFHNLDKDEKYLLSEPDFLALKAEMWKEVEKEAPARHLRSLWPRIAVAASLLLCLFMGGYFYLHKSTPQLLSQKQMEIAPGGNKAILTLSNGKQVSLNETSKGTVLEENGQVITKTNEGVISYLANNQSSSERLLTYNTITTPKGGQWTVVLPDGTKVMLDAISTIKYPVFFAGNERKVEVSGQAYFEVAHNAEKPFRVKSKGQIIEVLGTKFNISAYDDEFATKTTLLEGSVRVSTSGESAFKNAEVRLRPGQQTILQANKLMASDADLEEAFAWKNGYFVLNNESLESIMRKLSRWYNIDVEYKGDIPKRQFGGKISINTNLVEVLKVLELSKVHFTIEGRKLIVTP